MVCVVESGSTTRILDLCSLCMGGPDDLPLQAPSSSHPRIRQFILQYFQDEESSRTCQPHKQFQVDTFRRVRWHTDLDELSKACQSEKDKILLAARSPKDASMTMLLMNKALHGRRITKEHSFACDSLRDQTISRTVSFLDEHDHKIILGCDEALSTARTSLAS